MRTSSVDENTEDKNMNDKELLELAEEIGFEHYNILDVSTLVFRQDIRDMCNPQACQFYNTSWSCPPAIKDVDYYAEKAGMYSRGIIVQTQGKMEDSFDFEGMAEIMELFRKRFNAMNKRLQKAFDDVWPMGAGTCGICEECTYPDEPCRFPDKMYSSMEASGLYINQVCTDNGLKYYYGPDSLSFTGCFLFN